MAINLAEIIILCLVADYVCKKFNIPGLVGMLIIGILLGPSFMNLLHNETMVVASDLRLIALIIILLRAGLELKKETLHKVGYRALLLSFFPAFIEAFVITLLGPSLLGLTRLESAILGSILAAVSPAVVVPMMVKFQKEKRGTEKGIPTLLLAASSIDDVVVIVGYSILLGIYTGGKVNVAYAIVSVPLSIIIGALFGLLVGFILYHFFDRYNPRATKKALSVIGISIISVQLGSFVESFHIPYAALIAVMALGFILVEKREKSAHEISRKLEKIWVFAEIILFSLVGASVDVRVALQAGLMGGFLIILGLIGRSIGTWSCLIKSKFTYKERLFIVISYLPKATVQAAIGAGPLIAMKSNNMDSGPGEIILAVAVLSIIITAAPGAYFINKAASLLEVEK
ncbi:MAG: sodium:proton antiporter [Spirochaetia bacterium]|nr:sodium:proton antiporter [Spirochaetia bacterium]